MAKGRGKRKPRYIRDMERRSTPVKEPVTIDSGQDAHASTLDSARHEAGRRRAPNGKFLIPVAVGALGGAAYLGYRHHRRTNVKKFYDPFTDSVVELSKAGYGGAGLPDRCCGASTPMIGQTRSVGMLKPTGKHVSHANDLERFTPLPGYRRTPSGKGAQRLLHVKGKGKDRAAREFRGELVVAHKALLTFDDVNREATYGRQVSRRGARIEKGLLKPKAKSVLSRSDMRGLKDTPSRQLTHSTGYGQAEMNRMAQQIGSRKIAGASTMNRGRPGR